MLCRGLHPQCLTVLLPGNHAKSTHIESLANVSERRWWWVPAHCLLSVPTCPTMAVPSERGGITRRFWIVTFGVVLLRAYLLLGTLAVRLRFRRNRIANLEVVVSVCETSLIGTRTAHVTVSKTDNL